MRLAQLYRRVKSGIGRSGLAEVRYSLNGDSTILSRFRDDGQRPCAFDTIPP
jgi:hypothetical protein